MSDEASYSMELSAEPPKTAQLQMHGAAATPAGVQSREGGAGLVKCEIGVYRERRAGTRSGVGLCRCYARAVCGACDMYM